MPHAPGLDGLRALAVLGVLAYHLDLAWAGGGFLGVEVFFTLSGFLITQLLVTEYARNGRIDVPAFAMARGKRLVPALVACLVATTLAYRFLLPADLPAVRVDALASLFYVQNWNLVLTGVPYGTAFERPPPLLHLWSLAVEGQLYVLWPLLLVGVLLVVRRFWAVTATLALAGLSAGLMVLQYDADSSGLAYYATDSRAAGFLIGAATALLWRPALWTRPLPPIVRHLIALLGLAGLVVLLTGFALVSEFDDHLYERAGFLRVGLATALVLVAATRQDGLVADLLSGPVLGWLGRRSYGIYLYHWPIFALTWDRHGILIDIARLMATFALAELSYRLLESPIRRARLLVGLRARAVTGVATCVAIASLAGVMAATTLSSPPAEAPSVVSASAPLPPTPVTTTPPPPAPSPPPTSEAPAPAVGPVLVVGDSIALGAADALRTALGPDTEVDAEVGRQFSSGVAIVSRWAGRHDGPIVVVLGANGTVQDRDVQAIVAAAGSRRLVLVGVAVDRRWTAGNNAVLRDAGVAFVDWAAIVDGHPDAVGEDGVHPSASGRELLAAAVAEALRA